MPQMSYSEIVIKRIKTLLNSRDLSIRDLAGMAGISYSTLENVLTGETKCPQLRTLHQIALAFNMTIAEFLDFPEMNEYDFDAEKDDDE